MKEIIPVRKSDAVAIVGFAKTTRDLAPWDKTTEEIEIWGCNEAYNALGFMKRWDRWFQMHVHESFSRADNYNDPNHYQWLQQKHNFPIYMQEKFEDVPAAVRFPIETAKKEFGEYFTSTFAYMMALAMLMGFKRIETYGFEMASDSEYAYQRPNAEYIIGVACGKGIDVEVHSNWMLRGRMYGYKDDSIGFRQQLEFRKNSLRQMEEKARNEFYVQSGRSALAMELASKGKIQREDLKGEVSAMAEKANYWNMVGASQHENDFSIRRFDNHNGSESAEYPEAKPKVMPFSVESPIPQAETKEVKDA